MKIENIYDPNDPKELLSINDIQTFENDSILKLLDQRGSLIFKRNGLFKDFANKFEGPELLPDICDIKDLIDFKNRMQIEKQRAKATKIIKKIQKMQTLIDLYDQELREETQKKSDVSRFWITFNTIQQRNKTYNYFFNTHMDQCCYSCCSCCFQEDDRMFDNKLISVSRAHDPSNINWANFDTTFLELFIRRSISIFITIGLLIGSFILISYIKFQEEVLYAKYPKVDCSLDIFTSITKQEVVNDYQSGVKTGFVDCYCSVDKFNRIDDTFSNGKQICLEYFSETSLRLAMPFFIVFAIVFINFTIRLVYRTLSVFEKHKYLSSEIASKVVKIFLSQFLNTVFIIKRQLLFLFLIFVLITRQLIQEIFSGKENTKIFPFRGFIMSEQLFCLLCLLI